MTTPLVQRNPYSASLAEIQRIKQWQVAHKADHPMEYGLWEVVLTLWLMGWVGWLPAVAFDAWWALPLCAIAMDAPALYIGWRAWAHATQRLRCDWLDGSA